MNDLVVTAQIPEYLPDMAYFDRINKSGLCIFLDSVKLERKDNCARTRILGQREPELLTISVKRSRKEGQLIHDAVIEDNNTWKKKHLKKLYHVYKNAPYFDESYPALADILQRDWTLISDLNRSLIEVLCKRLQIQCDFKLSSELFGEITNADQLVDLFKIVKGNTFLAEEADRPFLNRSLFEGSNIRLSFHRFYHPEYNQQRDTFTPGLSIIDALFNCGNMMVNSMFNQSKI